MTRTVRHRRGRRCRYRRACRPQPRPRRLLHRAHEPAAASRTLASRCALYRVAVPAALGFVNGFSNGVAPGPDFLWILR
jgi:hypothetical protein